MGKGVVGAIASPFTATLKVATDITEGISGTTNRLVYGEIKKQGRYRHPRYISPTGIIEVYHEELAEAFLVLSSIEKGLYSDEIIRYIAKFPVYKKGGVKENIGIFLVTDRTVFYVLDLEKVKYKIYIKDIVNAEMDSQDQTDKES